MDLQTESVSRSTLNNHIKHIYNSSTKSNTILNELDQSRVSASRAVRRQFQLARARLSPRVEQQRHFESQPHSAHIKLADSPASVS